jgi:hypothetical protein
MATARAFGPDEIADPVTGDWQIVLLERTACARAVCSRCRFGQPLRPAADGFYHDVNVGNGVFPHRCDASPIWERDREER